jgi:hypothetical protein
MSESRLPRRSLFALLASIPLALVGMVGRRRLAPALPPTALPGQEAVPEVVAEVLPPEEGALVAQMMRHTEALRKTLNESHEQIARSLSQQLDELAKQNERMASQQYELLDLQQKLMDEQTARDLAAKARGTT